MYWLNVLFLAFTLSCASVKAPMKTKPISAPTAIGPQLDLKTLRDFHFERLR